MQYALLDKHLNPHTLNTLYQTIPECEYVLWGALGGCGVQLTGKMTQIDPVSVRLEHKYLPRKCCYTDVIIALDD